MRRRNSSFKKKGPKSALLPLFSCNRAELAPELWLCMCMRGARSHGEPTPSAAVPKVQPVHHLVPDGKDHMNIV
ncbi:hypothetical protein OUZ56_016094 [Daphnia magna]|uniref:Uncharacterized protein n=1 Tax=Daphnia magna TaxID=35525 RepID=A0ABR0APM7_9CRUS|nr:hypothetical protein OUZ56_016094 [Daphnia magna]